jgi:hypothetical protein
MQPDIRLAEANDPEEDDAGECCPVCGSDEIVGWEFYGPTGVVAPDGGCEYRIERGIRCLSCGAIEEE